MNLSKINLLKRFPNKKMPKAFPNQRMAKYNRRGQVADTMTWIVATIIIVLVLILFVYASSILAKTKGIERFVKGLFSEDDEEVDWIKVKTDLAYEIEDKNKALIEKWIEDEKKS
jgi:hypothetical protein